MVEQPPPVEYVVRRMCASRKVELVQFERTQSGVRFQIANGKLGTDRRAAWCAVDDGAVRRDNPEQLIEVVALSLALGIDEVHGVPPVPRFTGRFRVYFNHHAAAPLMWCVATDAWELAVRAVAIDAPITTVYKPKATPDHEDGRPSAWLEVDGVLVVVDGEARFARRAS